MEGDLSAWLIRKNLGKKYLVYNLGISGYTTLDMFMLYSSLFYSIRPDIVIAMFFGSEIVSGAMSDTMLLKDHNFYYHQIFEINIKKSQRSIMPTLSDVRDIIEKTNYSLIIESILLRLEQFKNAVISNHGDFYPIITPYLIYKQQITKEEQTLATQNLNTASPYFNHTIQHIKNLIKELKSKSHIKLYDSNDAIQDVEEFIFIDSMHINKKGCEIIGKYFYKIIKDSEKLN